MARRQVTSGAARCRDRARLNRRSNADWQTARGVRGRPQLEFECAVSSLILCRQYREIDPGGMVFDARKRHSWWPTRWQAICSSGVTICATRRLDPGQRYGRARDLSRRGLVGECRRRSAGTRRERPGAVSRPASVAPERISVRPPWLPRRADVLDRRMPHTVVVVCLVILITQAIYSHARTAETARPRRGHLRCRTRSFAVE